MDRLKADKLRVDIERVQQELLEPFTPFPFDLTNPQGFSKFTHNLISACMEHRIDSRVGGMINGAVANYIRYTQPPQGITVAVTQQQTIDFDKLLRKLPEDEQRVLARAIKRIEDAEVGASKSQP